MQNSRCRFNNAGIKENICSTNTSVGIKWPGISLTGAKTKVSVENNECNGNYPSGIEFRDGAGGNATGNTCSDHAWSKIAVRGEGTDPIVFNNRCSNNGAWGIISWAGADPLIGRGNTGEDNYRKLIMQRE